MNSLVIEGRSSGTEFPAMVAKAGAFLRWCEEKRHHPPRGAGQNTQSADRETASHLRGAGVIDREPKSRRLSTCPVSGSFSIQQSPARVSRGKAAPEVFGAVF